MSTDGAREANSRIICRDLREWIERSKELGQVRVVEGATWQEDIGMATGVLQHTDNAPAVIFDSIPGYPQGYRVLVNSFGSLQRIALALGLPVESPAQDLVNEWRTRLHSLEPIPPKYVDDGPILENVHTGDDIDVLEFPTPKWHDEDGGRYLGTGSIDITVDPDEGWVNCGTYRVMVHDSNRVGFYISPGKQGRIQRQKYFDRNEPCPVVVVTGVEPALYLAGCTEIDYGLSELAWAGGVKGAPLEVIRGRVTGLPIPANAEIALEGYAYPGEVLPEGPFGEWTGYYASASRKEPFIQVKAVYHRNNPIIYGAPPSKPPNEQARYRAFLRSANLREELEKAGVPDISGVWCHPVGGSRLLLVVSIKQRYPGHARQAGHLAAMCHAGAYLGRYVIVVDEDIDATDLEEVMWAVCTRADPAGAIDIINRAWSGPLDPAIPKGKKGFNSRAIIDACRPYEWKDEFPIVNEPSPEMKKLAKERWGYLTANLAT
ncbi:MAG: UbiD family decarboxylase [Chloroflexi bacterium]|nr:UbiD family decarboxylase [Chloroflexota bacterium]